MAQSVEGGPYYDLDGQLLEIKRQLRQSSGYPFDPTKLKKHLQDAIEGKFGQPQTFSTWKTIKLGTGIKTDDEFQTALNKSGCKIGDWARDILGKPPFTVAAQEVEVELVRVTVAELGFKKGANRSEIYARASELGLDLCSAEVGPQLRLQYKNQPNGEWVLIGMEPIVDSDGDLRVFYVGRLGSGLWLGTDFDFPDAVWDPGHVWVFVRRK